MKLNFSTVRMAVIGDVMLDRFFYGSVNRVSPEAPVPVFCQKSEKRMLGGAGNVAANAASLGCAVRLVGVVGDDDEGGDVAALVEKLGCPNTLVRAKDALTVVKTRFIAGHQQLLRADQEAEFAPDAAWTDTLKKEIAKAIKVSDIVLLSDYNKGVLSEDVTQGIIRECRRKKIPVIVDPKGRNYAKYAGATLIKPNLKEFSEMTGEEFNVNVNAPDFKKRLKAAALKLLKKHGIRHILVTLGEHGMAFVSLDAPREMTHVSAEAREIFDVSGAGDTSLAVLGAALAMGMAMPEAMRLANMAAGIVIGKLGTACVSVEELERAILNNVFTMGWPQEDKILSADEAQRKAEELRKKGKVVGFTNGCFDLMHLGHLYSFIQAKKECDVLFVGVNSDASVKSYKGENRPIQNEQTRAMLVAALPFVDHVVIFGDRTALPLVEKIRPGVVAKEGYALKDWPEGQHVVAYGGRAVILKRLEGYSTTGLVERMKN